MSHTDGRVVFPDGEILFFEYNGTVDQVIPSLYKTEEEMIDNWRSGEWRECTCGTPGEDVQVATSYGGGSFWQGKACRKCMCILSPISPDFEEEVDGFPDWWIYADSFPHTVKSISLEDVIAELLFIKRTNPDSTFLVIAESDTIIVKEA